MPRFDGTGPQGQGQMTGRGLGPCARGMGGWGLGCGLGNGRRFGGYRNFLTRSEEKEELQAEAEALEQDLKAVKERLSDLDQAA